MNKWLLIAGLVVTGAIGALKALQPLEPTWAWITSAIPVLTFVAGYLTVPGNSSQVAAHKGAS